MSEKIYQLVSQIPRPFLQKNDLRKKSTILMILQNEKALERRAKPVFCRGRFQPLTLLQED